MCNIFVWNHFARQLSTARCAIFLWNYFAKQISTARCAIFLCELFCKATIRCKMCNIFVKLFCKANILQLLQDFGILNIFSCQSLHWQHLLFTVINIFGSKKSQNYSCCFIGFVILICVSYDMEEQELLLSSSCSWWSAGEWFAWEILAKNSESNFLCVYYVLTS